MEKIGEKIKKLRRDLGMSADFLAKKIGKNRATIYRYENQTISNLPISVLIPLAKALKTTPTYLMGWKDKDDLKASKLSEIDKKVSDMIELSDYLKEKGFEFEILEIKVKFKKADKSTSLELEVLNEYFKDGLKNIENLLNGLLDK